MSLIIFNFIQYSSSQVERVHTKNIELPSTSLESVPRLKYSFEQQLLTQTTHKG